MTTIQQLTNMVGKTYMYGFKNIKIVGYIIIEDKLKIKTASGRTLVMPLMDMPDFIAECLPVHEEKAKTVKPAPDKLEKLTKIAQTLLKEIKQLKKQQKCQ